MRYLVERLFRPEGNMPPGIDRKEFIGVRYELLDDIINIFDYDDNIITSINIDRNDDYFKVINLDSNEIIFEN